MAIKYAFRYRGWARFDNGVVKANVSIFQSGSRYGFEIYSFQFKGIINDFTKKYKTKREAKEAARDFMHWHAMPCDVVCEWQIGGCEGCSDCKWSINFITVE